MTARLIPSPEEEELRASVRAFLERKSPEAEVRRLMISPDGFDRSVWAQMANQLGLQGLAVPERFGGSGFGFRELAIAVEEMGRALYTGPFFSSAVLATSLLLDSGDEDAMAKWLPQLAEGMAIGTVALAASVGLHRNAGEFSLTEQDGGVVLDGTIDYVSDAAVADVILVAHRDDRGLSVVAVEGRDQSVRAEPLVNVDETRRFASLMFDGTRGEVVGAFGGGAAWFSRAMDRGISALAVECVGGAQKCLEMAVDYAKERFTFGRAIGSYQAIKHKCADMKIAVDAAAAAAAWQYRRPQRTAKRCRPRRPWPRPTALRRTSAWRETTSRYMADSDSRGSARRTCTSSAPKPQSSSSDPGAVPEATESAAEGDLPGCFMTTSQ